MGVRGRVGGDKNIPGDWRPKAAPEIFLRFFGSRLAASIDLVENIFIAEIPSF